jgi:hypothetical protein
VKHARFVTHCTLLTLIRHRIIEGDGARFHTARVPGFREALQLRYTESPRLENVLILTMKENSHVCTYPEF